MDTGGMQALEWAILGGSSTANHTDHPHNGAPFVQSAVVIGCGAAHTAWQIAFSETQRQAIYLDPKWNNGDIDFK
jgi:homoserine O-acetyltransferase